MSQRVSMERAGMISNNNNPTNQTNQVGVLGVAFLIFAGGAFPSASAAWMITCLSVALHASTRNFFMVSNQATFMWFTGRNPMHAGS